jgi:hypothetical protein
MRNRAWWIIALALLVASTVPCAAMPDESPFAFDPLLRLLGADLGVGYRGLQLLPNADTTFWVYAGGGYEWLNYYRDSAGAIVGPDCLAGAAPLVNYDPTFTRIEAAWRLGVTQGFAWNPRVKANLVEAFLFYRGRRDWNQVLPNEIISLATIPDKDGMFMNMLQAGFAYNDVLYDMRHKTKDGFSAEVSAEWAPSFLFNTIVGHSDYLRFNGTLWYFLPLYDREPARETNLFSVYLGEYFSADYMMALSSAPVPMYIRQSFGGRTQVTGLGSEVRGVDTASLDTNEKVVNSFELRVNLPAIVWRDLMPGVAAFWDIGYFNQLGEPWAPAPMAPGLVSSVGAEIGRAHV